MLEGSSLPGMGLLSGAAERMQECCVFSILQGCSPAAYENLLSQSENPKRNSCRALSRRLAVQSCRRLLLERGKGLLGPQGRASISPAVSGVALEHE